MAMDREYLEEQWRKDYELLKELEDEYRLASDPRQRAKFKRDIQTLKEQIGRREAELKSLAINEPFQIDAVALKKYADKYQSRYGLLKLLGMPQAVNLEEVYTKVRFLDDLSIRRFESIEALEKAYREGQQRQFQIGRERSAQDGIIVANEYQYLMVLGGPGAGKSTFLRRLGLEALKGKEGQFQHECIPIMLELKQFLEEVKLTTVIAREFEDFGFPPSEEFAAKALEKGKLLVLLDGLDEIPKDRFNVVIDAIQAFAVRYEQNRFVASCRIAAYRSGFQRFRDIELADFGDEQIQQFIGNWFSSELDKQSGTAKCFWKLLNQPENKAAKELAQTPLLLTFICLVYDRSQELPKQRSTLYKNALDILLKEWAAEKRVKQDAIYRGLNTELEKVLLAEVAYEGFANDQLFFQQQELINKIQAFLSDTVDNPKYLDGAAVLKAIAAQQGILVERAKDIFSFSHLTLQEYLTAYHINEEYDLLEKLVDNYLTDQRWQEVFLLVAELPSKADTQLTLMNAATRSFINTPTLQALLNWTEQVTGGSAGGSAGGYTPVGKRAVAIFFARAHARTRARTLDLARLTDLASADARARARVSAHARTLTSTLDLVSASDLAHASTLARVSARTLANDLTSASILASILASASAFACSSDLDLILDSTSTFANAREELKIFKDDILSALIDELETLQSEIPDNNQSQEVWRSFANRIEQIYLNAFQLKREWLELSEEEVNALSNYLYACELMIRCKESAVRVSRKTWEEIEGRMLLPTQGQSAELNL